MEINVDMSDKNNLSMKCKATPSVKASCYLEEGGDLDGEYQFNDLGVYSGQLDVKSDIIRHGFGKLTNIGNNILIRLLLDNYCFL